MNAVEIEAAISDLALQPFDAMEFPFAFPVPLLTEQNKTDLTACAEDILLAREVHFPATIADLYDPDNMPENLRHAHERNDEVLDASTSAAASRTTPSVWKNCLSCIRR